MNKLILKKDIRKLENRISKTFGCSKFEPTLCCLCQEVSRFVNELSEKEHDPKICQSE